MSTLKLNHFGEIDVTGDDLIYFSPVTEFNNVNVEPEELKQDYSKFLDKVNYNDLLAPMNDITSKGKYIEFHYHQENTTFYHTIRNLDFEKQLDYFRSLVEIAKLQEQYNMQVLWQIENFVISHEENDEKVRALLYEFSDDFKIYDNTQALNGLKNMVLIGLTKLNNIIGKPNKADFVNKSDEVINFAQEVLMADNIEAIEENINHRIEIIEQQREEERRKAQQREEEKNKKKKFIKKPKKNKSIQKPRTSTKEQIKQKLKQQYNGNDKSKKKKKDFSPKGIRNAMFSSTRNTIITMIVTLFIIILVLSLPALSKNNAKEEQQQKEENQINKKLTTIYREHVDGSKKKAHQKMFAINYKKIPNKEDKKIYLDWLIEDKKYTKALDLNKDVAYTMGENINKDNIDEMKKINSGDNYKVLNFFIADYDHNFQTVIENEKYVDLKRENVANKLAQAYILSNQNSDLKKKVNKVKKDKGSSSKEYKNLKSAQQYYETTNEELEDELDEKKKAQDKVDELKKEVDKAKKKDKDKKEKELNNAKKSLESAEDRYNKTFDDIVDTKPDEAIEK